MRKIIMIVVVAIIVTGAAACVGIGIAKVIHDSNNNQAGFINIPGITNQDIRLCHGSYINGGKYYHHFNNAKLTCTRQQIEVEFDRSSEE